MIIEVIYLNFFIKKKRILFFSKFIVNEFIVKDMVIIIYFDLVYIYIYNIKCIIWEFLGIEIWRNSWVVFFYFVNEWDICIEVKLYKVGMI